MSGSKVDRVAVIGACDAIDNDVPCDDPGIAVFARGCVHEHVRQAPLCSFHAKDAGRAACRVCWDDFGHFCPVLIRAVAGA